MSSRAEIEQVLDRAYAARQRQDLNATVACFHPDGCFSSNGAEGQAIGHEQCGSALAGLFETFTLLEFHPHCRVIDPPRAVVHWRGKFRANNTGQVADTDILDLLEIRDGRIASLTSFFDTALAVRLTAPPA
jgi:ketosteroid isomerase-like protein